MKMNIKQEKRLNNEKNKFKYYCKCGHHVYIYPFENKNKKLCDWCNTYVYINQKEQFKELILKEMNKDGFK